MSHYQKIPLECNNNNICISYITYLLYSELKAVSDDGKKVALLVKDKKESSEESQYIEVMNNSANI